MVLPGVVVHTYNPSTQEAKKGGLKVGCVVRPCCKEGRKEGREGGTKEGRKG
jgi:hypothetical protein